MVDGVLVRITEPVPVQGIGLGVTGEIQKQATNRYVQNSSVYVVRQE